MVTCVGRADCDVMVLMGQRSVGLTARPRKRNFPHICWMYFLLCLPSGGELDVVVVSVSVRHI
jgi:hypothetical protein